MAAALNAVAEERAVANAARPYGLSFPWDNLYFYHFSKRCLNVCITGGSTTYVRWGRTTCEGDATLVYDGKVCKFLSSRTLLVCWLVGHSISP